MKSAVAPISLATSLALLAVLASAQTTRRAANKQHVRGMGQNETIKICRGVSIPEGYTIIAETTSPACPGGAYVLKKDDPASQNSAGGSQNQRQSMSGPTTESRPRRAAQSTVVEQQQSKAPVLNGAIQPDPHSPFLLGTTAPTVTPVAASDNARPVSGPEEVAEGDVVRVDTTLVTVPVSVLDRQGKFVPNLRREDFSILEDGVEQQIAYFEPTEKPFTVALLLDTSASTHFHLWEIKEAAIAFAKQLRPQDRVLIVTFNDEVLLLTEATNDLNVITGVIEQNANTGNATRLYDALQLVVRERLDKIKGRKAIVLFTDGVDTASEQATYESSLHEAEELDALIYPIQYDTSDYQRAMQNGGGSITIVSTSSNWPFPSSRSSQTVYGIPSQNGMPLPGTSKADYERADQYLHALADKTGARLYQANDPSQLAQAFARIAEELRRQYSLGYYPQTQDSQNGERRQIKVRVRQPNFVVRARDSYVRQGQAGPTR